MSSAAPDASPRDRILDAARQVFAARGFRGGSLNDVAVLAGYTRAGLLHHFPSKESMLLALLEQRDQQVAALVPDESEDVGILTLLHRLSDAPDLILRDRELVQLAHVLTAEASGAEHPARTWVAERQARFRRTLTRAIRHSIESGELPGTLDPAGLAAVVYGMFEGLENQWLIDPSVDPRAGHQLMVDLLEKTFQESLPTSR